MGWYRVRVVKQGAGGGDTLSDTAVGHPDLDAAKVSADRIAHQEPSWGGGDAIEVYDDSGELVASREAGGDWHA